MESIESRSAATRRIKPSQWFSTLGLSKLAPARDIDGFITAPESAEAAALSLYGAIQRSYPNDIARWLEVAGKLDTLLADLHADPDMRMIHSWLPDSRFNRIVRANNHPEFTRDHAVWLLGLIGE
jgi:hypothetical protein